ncbi:MAG: STT3 domain-containing protein [Candidatus Woesearchaeota archaeon]
MADDEIKIDFSNLFKKKKQNKTEEKEQSKDSHKDVTHNKKNHENIVEEKSTNSKTEDIDDSISVDFSIIINWTKKYWHIIVLLLLVIFIVDMRMKVTEAPITEEWARSTYYNFVQEQILLQIEQQNPNLPAQQKELLLSQQFSDVLRTERAAIEAQIQALANQYRDAISYEYNGKRYIFLGDIDSYYWLRFARNIVEKGHICDEIRDGICYDAFALAPLGRPDNPDLHHYMLAWTYMGAQKLGFDIPLMHAAKIAATILAIIMVIPAFILGNLLAGKIAGIVVALLVNTNIMHIQRTLGADDDSYQLLFPLIILIFIYLAINAKDNKARIINSVLAAFSVVLFKLSWSGGWWNIYVMIVYGLIIYLGYLIVHQFLIHKKIFAVFKHQQFKETLTIFGTFYVTGLIMFYLISFIRTSITVGDSIKEYINAVFGPLQFALFQKAPVNMNMWPNVITTVAEFNPLPLARIPAQIFGNYGGLIFFAGIFGLFILMAKPLLNERNKLWIIFGSICIAGLFSLPKILQDLNPLVYLILLGIATFSFMGFILLKKIKIDKTQQHYIIMGIVLALWFIASIYATTKGVRFALLVGAPLAIMAAIGIQFLFTQISNYLSDNYDNKYILTVTKIIILLFLLIAPLGTIHVAYTVSESYIPNYNVAWHTALINIRDNSQPDAIINSWWDFGHWFKFTTERGITLDGATQNAPVLHWLGKMLMTNDEKLSVGILRMMACGSNTAFDAIVNVTEDTPVAVDILNEIMILDDRQEITNILNEYGFDQENVDNVLQYSHCDPPENFVITSNDMIGKAGVWSHFGAWDFYRAEIAQMNLVRMSRNEIIENLTNRPHRNTTEREVINLYEQLMRQTTDEALNAWIAPWPSFYGEGRCQVSGDIYLCDNGFVFDTINNECYVNTSLGIRYPRICSYVDGSDVKINEYNDNILVIDNLEMGVMFWPEDPFTMRISMMHPKLVGSMFARLYWMQGHGLRFFDKFDEQRSPLGTVIYTWKVDWEGTNKINIYGVNTETLPNLFDTATETVS